MDGVVRAARIISVVGWVSFAAVVIRVVSGGGTLRGVGYVLGTEPVVLVAFLLASLAASGISILALLRDVPRAWAISVAAAVIALSTSLLLGLDGHGSAIFAAVASGVVLLVGLVVGRRRGWDG
jgi:hypothetical protein